MLRFLKRKSPQTQTQPDAVTVQPETTGIFLRLKKSLAKTRENMAASLSRLILGKKTIDVELCKQIETILLQADVGATVTADIMNSVTQKLARNELANPESLLYHLKQELITIVQPEASKTPETTAKPFVMVVVGVNGVGKTTTIGKLAHFYQANDAKVMLAAGDTFRAAAIEQLQVWGERNHTPVIAQHLGADSASVIFDAFSAAKARDIDILIADTAGRLHTKQNLMEELKKITRVLAKLDATAPHEILLVLDASIGQNAIHQAEQFHAAVGVTGLVITKLDGTAKGGVVFAIAKKLGLPIRFIGTGENISDLAEFDPEQFVNALFDATE